MLLNLSKDDGILSKDSFDASHLLSHGSLCSSKGLGCNLEIADNNHDSKKILSSDVDKCPGSEDELGPAGGEECAAGTDGADIRSEVRAVDIVMWGS